MDIYTLHTDGSYITGLDFAGFGGVIYKNDQIFHTFSGTTQRDLNYHEVVALYEGLKVAQEMGISRLTCVGDHKRLMQVCNTPDKAIRAHYFLKSEYFPKLEKLLESFEEISFQWAPRGMNKVADRMAGKYKKHTDVSAIFEENLKDKNLFSMLKGRVAEKNSDGRRVAPEVDIHLGFNIKPSKGTTHSSLDVVVWEVIDNTVKRYTHQIDFGIKPLVELMCQYFSLYQGKISFYADGALVDKILGTIRRQLPISKANKASFNLLQKTLDNYDEWTIYNHPLAHDTPTVARVKTDFTEEMLVEAIRVLGQEDYQLGDRVDLETHYDLPVMKRNKINEIQKMFLSSFIRLGFKEEFRLFSKEEKNTLLQERVKILKDKGIKLR